MKIQSIDILKYQNLIKKIGKVDKKNYKIKILKIIFEVLR
jgi:hypothetical protein